MALDARLGPLQPVAKAIAGPALRAYFRLRAEGAGRVPDGPAILAPNHDSMWDIPLLVVACPRPIVFMARQEVFDSAAKDWFFTRLGGFPIAPGGADVSAMKASLAALRAGRLLCLYPEGTRRANTLLPFRTGAARIALTTGAPIVPVAIVGTGRIWPRGARFPRRVPVIVRYGEPIPVEPERGSRRRAERALELTERLRDEVARLAGV